MEKITSRDVVTSRICTVRMRAHLVRTRCESLRGPTLSYFGSVHDVIVKGLKLTLITVTEIGYLVTIDNKM